jgi:ABC-type glycerol-3-phosphate transport system substrate-binding protein
MDAAAKAELLRPLDHDLPAGAFADLLAPAQQLAKYQGAWLGLPVTVDAPHLVYDSKTVRTPPAQWDQLLGGGTPWAFAVDDDDVFLFQYLENHGRLASARQSVPLDIGVMTSVLSFYQRARAANLIPDSVFAAKDTGEVWQAFAAGQTALAQVEASDFVAGHANVPNAGFAPLPTQDGASTTLVSSWNYAIITSDGARHAAAAEFLNWLDEPSRLAQWAAAAHAVPARRSAFAFAVNPPEYGDFLLKLLEAGIVAPTFAQREPYQTAWHTALQTVLRGQAAPSEAAQRAAQVVAP